MRSSGHFLPAIITLFSTLALVPILVVVLGLIIRRRKESIKKQRPKNENEFKSDGLANYEAIINGNEVSVYEIINSELDDHDIGVYDEINENESKVKEIANNTVEYLEMSAQN